LVHLFSSGDHYVRNIAYTEDTTIKFNYPYEGNDTSIGIDLASVEGQKEEVIFVKENLEALFIGPVELVQGGQAFILILPVISEGIFQGQIHLVIDSELLQTKMKEISDSYDVSLTISYPNEEPILSIGDNFENNYITVVMENEHINWDLDVYNNENDSSVSLMRHTISILGVAASVLVAYYVFKNGKLSIEVKHQAIHDSLTNDFNRMKFVDDFNKGIHINNLIAFTDINKFKNINDTYGHHFGDWGLKQISNKFNESNQFITYRNSGDEFIIVSKKEMSEHDFLKHVKLFNSEIYNEQLQQDIEITLSIGVIEKIPKNLEIETMLMYLDYAMYDAKKEQKTYTLVDDALMNKYKEQKKIEDIIIHDINDNKLITFFQPIINLKEKRIEGVEVLSRWIRDGKMVPAYQFIDILKRIRYIEKVDQNLINNLQSDYLKINQEFDNQIDLYFAINLSAEILKMFEYDYERFDKFVENNKIPKNKLVFEISEDINLGVISEETLSYITEKGYDLAIDDFGSGVSKLTDVLSGKLQSIKTDKGMLPLCKKDTKNVKAFSTIIKAVNASGSKVCVEGVETTEQLEIIIKAGSASAQGYLFAKPLSYDELIDFIRTFDFDKYQK